LESHHRVTIAGQLPYTIATARTTGTLHGIRAKLIHVAQKCYKWDLKMKNFRLTSRFDLKN